jgi:hypothetical protein
MTTRQIGALIVATACIVFAMVLAIVPAGDLTAPRPLVTGPRVVPTPAGWERR